MKAISIRQTCAWKGRKMNKNPMPALEEQKFGLLPAPTF